jgi:hypothetical protein
MKNRNRCAAFVLAWFCAWRCLLTRLQRRWWRGFRTTVMSAVLATAERCIGRLNGLGGRPPVSGRGNPPKPKRHALEIEDAPFMGGVRMTSEVIEHPDGEVYGVWWSATAAPSPLPPREPPRRSDRERVWVVLPGGMSSGNAFYVHDAARSGVFGLGPDAERWCVFHNPGIVTRCRTKPTPAITDLTYLEHFLRVVLPPRRVVPSIMGFSAGSMLAICAARAFSSEGVQQQQQQQQQQPKRENKEEEEEEEECGGGSGSCLLSCVVAVHGPDKLRDAFEALRANPCRLDIPFALSVYRTLVRSRCPEFLPPDRGGGVQHEPLCWTEGWPWMVRNAEAMRGRRWAEMEDALYSCEPAMRGGEPLRIPTMRVLARDDPIISYEDCVDPALFGALDEVVVQPGGGHCAAFRADPTLARRVREWALRRGI